MTEKLKMHSINKVDENIKRIGELFPNCLTEVKDEDGKVVPAIDFDMLKQELSNVVVEGNEERYQFKYGFQDFLSSPEKHEKESHLSYRRRDRQTQRC